MALDRISIEDLALRCVIGFNDWERKILQDVVITIHIDADTKKSQETDDPNDCVDYKKITKAVIQLVEASSFNLIEALAAHIADCVLQFDGVEATQVTVNKPGALHYCRNVCTTVSKKR